MRALLLLLIIFFPSIALAALFDVPSTDKSMQYLGMVFGSVAGLPIQASGNNIFGVLIYTFNEVVFALGIVIISYTGIAGTIHTAQEGKFLGEKWHPILVPVRAGLGMFLLLPSSGGYNWIQVGVMWFIIQGVGAANALWSQVMIDNQTQGNINANTSQVNLQNASGTVGGIFSSVLCMEAINSLPGAVTALGETIQAYQFGNQIQFGRLSKQGTEDPLCGSVTVSPIGSNPLSGGSSDPNVAVRQSIMATAILEAEAALEPAAQEALMLPQSQWALGFTFQEAANNLQSATTQMNTTFQQLSNVQQQAIIDGWITAGSYYYQLVAGGAQASVSVNLSIGAFNYTSLNNLLGSSPLTNPMNIVNAKLSPYVTYALGSSQTTSSSGSGQLLLKSPTATSSSMPDLFSLIFGSLFSDLAKNLEKQLSQGAGDPVISMANFGNNLMMATELVFWGSLVLIFTTWLAMAVFESMQPLANAINYLISCFVPLAILVITLMWTSGVILGIYVPLIPYLVFTFAALGWIFLVIEAILGAPLIALTLIIPSEDEIGKAGQAIIILLGLFLRPALMIVGFILAAKLLTVAIDMLNFGFMSTMVASTGGANEIGVFGIIAVLMLYVSMATGMVHEAFSIIYLLPNKILRWMGAGPEGEEIGGMVKELKGSAEKGATMGETAMKGFVSKAGKGLGGSMGGGGGKPGASDK